MTQRTAAGKFAPHSPLADVIPLPMMAPNRFTKINSVMDRHDAHKAALAELQAQMHAARLTTAELQSKIDSRKRELDRARAEATALLFGA